MPNDLLGYRIRADLFPGEDSYFKENPHVGGMAAFETGDVILNPYSPPEVNRDAVAKNEAFRLYMRDRGILPDFPISDEQKAAYGETPYGADEGALRETLAARIYSGDPSARATPEQEDWVRRLMAPPKRRTRIGRQVYEKK